ncbi:MAG: Brp/Blh family beta-carotene 15,15'-dioxygenase [Pseudomonadota bacterium]
MTTRFLKSPSTRSRQGRLTLPVVFSGPGFSRDGTPSAWLLATSAFVLFGLLQDTGLHSFVTIFACVSMLVIGMPHGMFDYLTLRRRSGHSKVRLVSWIAAYCGLGALALAGWQFVPLLALALFLVIAVVHFSEDWHHGPSVLFSIAMATSVIALPALIYPEELSRLFTLVAGTDARILTDIVRLIAPLALLISLVFVVIEASEQRSASAFRNAVLLASALLLPPGVGFALFFCLYHSPRHFVEGYDELEGSQLDRRRFFMYLTTASAAVFLLVTFVQPAAMMDQIVIASIFQTLAILTLPHLLLPYLTHRSFRI